MAIEIAFLSVVLRKSSIDHLEIDAQNFVQTVLRWEPDWFREDDDLLATSFMCPLDVRAFGYSLSKRTSLLRGKDWVVVEMVAGPLAAVHWLEFRGWADDISEVWLQGNDPGELVKIPSLLPGDLRTLPFNKHLMKLPGRDSHHDAGPHPKDFGHLIPAWGGKNLWYAEVGAGLDARGRRCSGGLATIEATSINFRTCQTIPLGSKNYS
jgi:hypothetical protein